MKYEVRLKTFPKKNLIKKPLYNNKYISARVYNNIRHTEFKYKKY